MSTYVKRCRENAGLTQAQLAEKMDVTVTSVQNWENGKTKIDLSRITDLALVFNVPAEDLIKEMLIEENKKRQDRWPDFLFDDETNDIIDTLHLNYAQQELFGLLYIYDAEYLKKPEIDFNTLGEDLKKIPYGFIDKVGSIRFMNQVDGLYKVIKYVKSDFLIKVLKQNSEAEFNIRKMTKEQICEFIDKGYKSVDEGADGTYDTEKFEGYDELDFQVSMSKAEIILPVLEETGAVHITDGHWSNPIRDDLPDNVFAAILEMCGFKRDLWNEGYYEREYNISYIRYGLKKVTTYHNISKEGDDECWMWEINEKGHRLLEWLQEK